MIVPQVLGLSFSTPMTLDPAVEFVRNQVQLALADGAELVLNEQEIINRLPDNWNESSFLYIPFARKEGISYVLMGPDLVIGRNSGAMELNSQGILVQMAPNVPRIEFNSLGEFDGHKMEAQLTNFNPWSISPENWSTRPIANPVLLNPNAIEAPDGTQTAIQLSNFTVSGIHLVNSSVVWVSSIGIENPLDGTKYFGIWLKSEGGTEQITLMARGSSHGGNPLTQTLVEISDEWRYYEVSLDFNAANNGSNLIGLISNKGTEPSSFYVWGAQLSETPGSLVITDGTIQTRLRETALSTFDVSPIVNNAITIIVKATIPEGGLDTSLVPFFWALSTGSSDYRFVLYGSNNSLVFLLEHNNNEVFRVSQSDWDFTTPRDVVIGVSSRSGKQVLSIDGITAGISESSLYSITQNWDKLYLGTRESSFHNTYGGSFKLLQIFGEFFSQSGLNEKTSAL